MLVIGSVKFLDGTTMEAEEVKIIQDAIFEAIKKNVKLEKQTFAVISWVLEECKESLEVKLINL